MKLSEFIEKKDEFITYLFEEKNASKHTIDAYENDLQQFIIFATHLNDEDKNNLSLKQLIERHLTALFYRKIKKSSIARKFSTFRSFELFLRKFGILLNLNLQYLQPEKKLPVFLTIDQITYLLDEVSNDQLSTRKPLRDKAILELLYATGMRVSELIAIKIQDIDMQQKTIRILGKGKKERIALFGSKAHDALVLYMAHERLTTNSMSDHLFINDEKKPLTARTIQRIIHMFGSLLKSEKQLTPHKIRHTFATHLLNQGVDLRVLQELLGHDSLATTEKYTHVSLENLIHMCDTKHPLRLL